MLIKSPLTGQASGSLGGVTASRNRYGQYFRERAVPVNPRSFAQNVVRAAMAVLVDAWHTALTDTQRAAWGTYAQNTPGKGSLGSQITLTAQTAYIQSNLQRVRLNLTRIDDAPLIFDRSSIHTPSMTVSALTPTTASVSFDEDDEWVNQDGAYFIVRFGQPQNAGRKYYGGPYRFILTTDTNPLPGDSSIPPASPQVMNLPFPVTAQGQVLFAIATAALADGRYTTPKTFQATVGP